MADNTLQFQWIVTLQGGLDDLFRDDPNIFVAGDLLWYPIEGDNKTRQAPDAMVAFGRPKGYRGSYKQWEEGGIPPQVVFEVLSPGNRAKEMARKLQFYDTHGVEEYYIYDPYRIRLKGYIRVPGNGLVELKKLDGYVSPRLGIRFDLSGEELAVYRPDGRPFESYLEVSERADAATAELERLRAQLRAAGIEPN